MRQILAPIIAFFAFCGAAQSADKVNLRLDWFHSSYHAPFFLGIDKGIYAEANIDLSVLEGRGSVQTIQLVGKGDDQFGFVAVDSIMRAVGAGIPVVSIETLMPIMGQAIFVLSNSGIMRLEDLKGRTVAVTPGGTNEALLPAVLASAGLKDSDLKKVTIDASAKVRMFLNRDVDAMIATAWAHSLFESGGGARAFVYSDYGTKMVGYSIVTNTDLTNTNPDLVRRFVAATANAWMLAKASPEAALDALATHSRPNAAPARRKGNSVDFAKASAFIAPAEEGKPYGYQSEKDWKDTQTTLLKYGVIKKELPVSAYMINTFAPSNSH